jgi:site-specific DNA-methyltransferase (adenine-specific)
MVAFQRRPIEEYVNWCRTWIDATYRILDHDASLYVWLGADQKKHFQPLPQFLTMMAGSGFESRSWITMRNQRGYGTARNWMAVRQELLYYVKRSPRFCVQYTDIPKILRGYYKEVRGERTENLARSRSRTIRPGNVWVDIQQVFYRREENVNGCYAQKPLRAIERIVAASSTPGDTVVDFFAHAGTTLLACERLGRRCLTMDIDPVFAEVTIRRLEHYRATGRLGWQRGHPFEAELARPAARPLATASTGQL